LVLSSLGGALWTWSVPGQQWVDLDRVGQRWAEQQIADWSSQLSLLVSGVNQRKDERLLWADVLARHLEMQALLFKLEKVLQLGPVVADSQTLGLINGAQELEPDWKEDFESLKEALQAGRKTSSVHLLAEDAERVSLAGKKSVQAQNQKQAQQRTILGKLQARLHDDLEARHGELKVLRNQGSGPTGLEFEIAEIQDGDKRGGVSLRVISLLQGVSALALMGLLLRATARSMRAESGLECADRIQARILEHSAECAVLLDETGRVVFISKRGLAALGGGGVRRWSGEHWQQWWLPEWQARVVSGLERAAAGEVVTLDLAMETEQGGVQWWEVVLAALPQEAGELRWEGRLLAVMHNTSQRRRAQQELKESEERFSAFVENAPAMVYIKDEQGRYVLVNRIYEELRNDPIPGLLGRRDQELVSQSKALEVEGLEVDVLHKGIARRVVEEFQLSSGESVYWRVLRFPLQLSSGKVLVGAIGVDVTRTVTAEAQLQEARDSAIQSARLKSEFLANMSHEIRTPMNGIIGMAGLLLGTELSVRQRDFAQTIATSADALLTILNDVLDFSKIEAGMLTFEEIAFDLESVFGGVLGLFAERAAHKGLELALVVEQNVPQTIVGDPGRLRQILMNLLGNALKFTNKGEVVLECYVEKAPPLKSDGVFLRFHIRDTGIGISMDAQKRLFKAFTQADGSTTRRYGGTGLGLAISQQLAQRMGGEMGVKSTPGQGSTFWFTAQFGQVSPNIQPTAHPVLVGCLVMLALPYAATMRGASVALKAAGARVDEVADIGELLEACRLWESVGSSSLYVLMDEKWCADVVGIAALVSLIGFGAQVGVLAPFNREALLDSELRCGCTRLFTMPVRTDALVAWVAGKPAASVAQEACSALGRRARVQTGLRLLVAEDNSVNQSVIRHQLANAGHTISFLAKNGRQVLAALEQVEVDAVLMDCQMPELDGYETTREIRRREGERPPFWIVAMTANTMEGDREKCLSAGMDDYVSKPLNERELMDVLARVPTNPRKAIVGAEAVDPVALARLRELGGAEGEALLVILVEQFIQSGKELTFALGEALAAVDFIAAAQAVHTLGGCAANFGAKFLVSACTRAEHAANTQNLASAQDCAEAILREYDLVRIALLAASLRNKNIQDENINC